MITGLIIYAVVAVILYIIGYWFFCKSYTEYRYKDRVSFDEYFDDNSGWFIAPAIGWPIVIILSPLILLIYLCYLITKKIKKYYNIED